jgi:hypothetical protein
VAELAPLAPTRSQGLVDVLDRILDKGLVVAGDIRINLANVELLTIRVRLLVCSIDKAEQIGLDWWRSDATMSGSGEALRLAEENRLLHARLTALEERLARLSGDSAAQAEARPAS